MAAVYIVSFGNEVTKPAQRPEVRDRSKQEQELPSKMEPKEIRLTTRDPGRMGSSEENSPGTSEPKGSRKITVIARATHTAATGERSAPTLGRIHRDLDRKASLLKQELESTKKIDERRRIRKELRELKEKKDKLLDENGNEKPAPTVASKFVMRIGSTKRDELDSGKHHRDRSPAKRENIEPEKPKSTRSTFSFKIASSEEKEETRVASSHNRKSQRNNEEPPSEEHTHRRTQAKREVAPVEEKRARRNREINNNEEKLEPRAPRVQQAEPAVQAPKRMTRRASLAELFKIDKDVSSTPPKTAPELPITASPAAPQKRMYAETQNDSKTKQGLMQSLTRLRSRRRSVREIDRKEELEGLMYVKTGDSVKLVSTSKGDEEAKEQRRVRRTSRRESHEKLVIDSRAIAEQADKELSAIEESPRSPAAKKSFTFDKKDEPARSVNTEAENSLSGVRTEEPGKGSRVWQPPPNERPGPKIWSPPRNTQEPINTRQPASKPGSFLPDKKPAGSKFGRPEAEKPDFGRGSVKDRMAFFRQAAEAEKKAKATQYKPKTPPSPVSPSGPAKTANGPTSPAPSPGEADKTERVSLKKAPDPNRQPRELKKKPQLKRQMSVSSLILQWCKDVTRGYKGVSINNFSGSFANGLAFCALIHKFNPDILNFDELDPENKKYNFELAFNSLKDPSVNVPCLLDVEDMVKLKKPEPRSVQCQVQMIFSKYRPKDLDMTNLVIA